MASTRPQDGHADTSPPDWFNRCTLELTFRVLRHSAPGSALAVRNALLRNASEGLYPLDGLPLSEAELRAVVRGLDRYCRSLPLRQHSDRVLATNLLLDWRMALNQRCGPASLPSPG